jgi:hypothetical protein
MVFLGRSISDLMTWSGVWIDESQILPARGSGGCLYSPEGMPWVVQSNRPNIRFRLIIIGGGRTFQKYGWRAARGRLTGPTMGSIGLWFPPSGPTSAGWVFASSKCFFLGCQVTLSSGGFWSLLDFILFLFFWLVPARHRILQNSKKTISDTLF